MSEADPLPLLPPQEHNPVPVFSCHVIVRPCDETGRVHARVANLPNVTAEGCSEREALTSIVRKFKETVQRHTARNERVPFTTTPQTVGAGEAERFIPVHL